MEMESHEDPEVEKGLSWASQRALYTVPRVTSYEIAIQLTLSLFQAVQHWSGHTVTYYTMSSAFIVYKESYPTEKTGKPRRRRQLKPKTKGSWPSMTLLKLTDRYTNTKATLAKQATEQCSQQLLRLFLHLHAQLQFYETEIYDLEFSYT